jgi:ABC-type glycerol-3-phosphate transport system substrate-binding protein
MRNITRLAAAVAACFAWSASAQQPVVLQWQTANLTESQYEPVWKATIAEFEKRTPGSGSNPCSSRARTTGRSSSRPRRRRRRLASSPSTSRPLRTTATCCRSTSTGTRKPPEFRKAWSDAMLSASKWKGQLYGLPIWGGTYAEIYNRDLVTKAGLDPAKPPKNWAEYLAWSKKLTGNDQWATAVLGGKTDTTTRVLLMWIWSNGGEAFNADMTEATFAKNPKSLEAIKFYLGLVKDGVAAPAPTTTNYLEQTNLFAQQKIATMRNAYWAIAKVVGDNPALKGKMFVAAGPANIPNAPTLTSVAASSISASCPHPDAAWKFIKFDAGKKWTVERAKVANWMPTRNDMADDPAFKADPLPRAVRADRQQRAELSRCPRPSGPRSPANDIVDAVQRALLAPEKTEEIFKDLDAKVTKKLKDV